MDEPLLISFPMVGRRNVGSGVGHINVDPYIRTQSLVRREDLLTHLNSASIVASDIVWFLSFTKPNFESELYSCTLKLALSWSVPCWKEVKSRTGISEAPFMVTEDDIRREL